MRKHELDVVSLVFGLFFVGSALAWGVTRDAGGAAAGWRLPTLLIAAGVVGLLSSLASRRGRADSADRGDAGSAAGGAEDPAGTP